MNYRILIVDDSPLLRALARRAVEQAGAAPERVREAQNGREALDALAQEPADIVLLDINMPVMDGYQFLEAKAQDPALSAVPVVLVTTEGNKRRLEGLTQFGVIHYLRKPFEPEELRAIAQDLLEGKE